ncbi:trihelix transcription factor GTL2-like isoform X2 [Impatiens glandulifera]|uniref:trihelix transcription factor GTL2-like isoform X2 n=1 Tax=Impatiens glandulifera TaxID=253017 RepID=UPI001FB123D2|nr:trihelix transcription factor GTL2-like isoform X2 [Impatiens glandulifera]
MFDEMPQEHFHQFIASSRPQPSPPPPPPSTTTQLPPSIFSSTTANFPLFDHHPNYPSHLHLQSQFLLHQLHHKNDQDHQSQSQSQMISSGLEIERDDRWTNDEVLELLRIRSNMENWFPDFTWNHVSRKLAEIGFKRSPEKCKEKFEEESQHLSNNVTYTKKYRFFSELEEICHVDQNPPFEEEEDPSEENAQQEQDRRNQTKGEKRKRSSKKKKFKKIKQFFEEIVNKMLVQQEELNNKLIQDMLKRDEENIAKEEAWKKQETERINKEIESRAKEHAIAKERQAKIIEFLNKFTSNSQNPNHHNKLEAASSSSTGPNTEKDIDTSKRWPREEVLALINLRSNHYRDEKQGLARGPLWERISKGMLDLGYNRSAKRCKEKWENINKYYRKTKDANKKRSVDSRTCPYFHQLSTLYNQTSSLGQPPSENHSLTETNNGNGINDDYYDDHNDDEEDHIGL